MAGDGGWFHAHVEPVSRGSGKSAVGLASYVTGEKLYDEENKRQTKRNHPGEVLAWGTVLHGSALSYLTDPQQLGRAWNDVQKSETRVNSRLASHENIASCGQFGEEDHIWTAKEIARRYSERYGVLVTWAVHKPTDHGNDNNWHIHLASNMRQITPEGFGPKVREIVAKGPQRHERLWQRQMYADVLNERLAHCGIDERVSPLSYAERGIDKLPTQHLGNKQNLMELNGKATKTGDHNREVKKLNRQYEAEMVGHNDNIRRAEHEAEIIDLQLERRRRIMDEEPFRLSTRVEHTQKADGERLDYETASGRTEQSAEFMRRYHEQHDQDAKLAKTREDEARTRENRGEEQDAKQRWSKAMADTYSRTGDPYLQMAEAVRIELKMFLDRQDRIKDDAAKQEDPQKRRLIELKGEIEASDFSQIQAERLAAIVPVLVGRSGSRAEMQDRETARVFKEHGAKLREERLELQKGVNDKAYAEVDQAIKEMKRGGRAPEKKQQAPAPTQAQRSEEEGWRGIPVDQPENRPARDLPPNSPAANEVAAERTQRDDQQQDRREATAQRDENPKHREIKDAAAEITDTKAEKREALREEWRSFMQEEKQREEGRIETGRRTGSRGR